MNLIASGLNLSLAITLIMTGLMFMYQLSTKKIELNKSGKIMLIGFGFVFVGEGFRKLYWQGQYFAYAANDHFEIAQWLGQHAHTTLTVMIMTLVGVSLLLEQFLIGKYGNKWIYVAALITLLPFVIGILIPYYLL